MNFRTVEEETRRKLLLMIQPTFLQGISTPESQQVIITSPASPDSSPNLPSHDWGPFGKYEYLGAGTPYKEKQKARIRPVSDLDRIAESHDMWYDMSERTGPSTLRNVYRGVADYGAGAAMMTAAFNPWSDLDFKGRVLAFTAGDVLMIQGLLRLNPATMLGMTVLDWIFY